MWRVSCCARLTGVSGVEVVSHTEAEGSEEQPTVVLLVHHQIQGRLHTSNTAVLIEERLAGPGFRGHVAIGRARGWHLSEEIDSPVIVRSAGGRTRHDWLVPLSLTHTPFALLLPQTPKTKVNVDTTAAMETVTHYAQFTVVAVEAAAVRCYHDNIHSVRGSCLPHSKVELVWGVVSRSAATPTFSSCIIYTHCK